MVYQDANMDKCRFYTHPFMLIIRQIQISAHFRYMDTLKRHMRLQTGTLGVKQKNKAIYFVLSEKRIIFAKIFKRYKNETLLTRYIIHFFIWIYRLGESSES